MARFTVHAETLLAFDIEYERDGATVVAILGLAGGEWRLMPAPQAGWRHIGSRRIEWSEALKRALAELVQ